MKVPLSVLRFVVAVFVLLPAGVALASAPRPGTTTFPTQDAVPGEIILQLSADAWTAAELQPALFGSGRTGVAAIDARLASVGATTITPVFDLTVDLDRKVAMGMDRILLVRYAGGEAPERVAAAFLPADGVDFAEPNRVARAMLTPNDPTYPSQWAHNNTGQAIKYGGGTVGTVDCDTDTDQAWDLQTGSASFILAIIDTGVDTGHPEFSGRVVAGYDYINNDSNPADDNGHGTCCAGIALGAGNNSQGIAGVAWGIKLMPVKVLDAAGSGSYTAVANGVNFAADNGAKILSMSLGGGASATLQTAINYAYGKGCAIFAAAGNSNRSSLDYPAGYSNTIAVGALSPCNERKSTSSCDGETWWGSNYGTGLDVMAPGVRIHTADIRGAGGFGSGDYITDFNGTSSATPHAAGIGALVWSQNPALTNATLQTVLQNNCDDMGTAGYDTQTGYGRMNAYRAVQNAGGGGGGGGTPVTIFSETFETNTVPGSVWSATDANATTGLDYWGDQSSSGGARVHGGSWSAYCADNSDRAGQQYDNNMNANMTLVNAVNVAGYTNVQISFWIWNSTYNSSDYLSFQYWNGSSWVQQQRWYGSSGGWINPVYNLTGFSTFRFRFIFFSNNSNRGEGAYVDDIVLTGVPPAGPVQEDGPVAVSLVTQGREVVGQPTLQLQREAAGEAFAIHPNPLRSGTSFSFSVNAPASVRIEVVSPDGRRVAQLSEDRVDVGSHVWTWDGQDGSDRDVASGAYYARLVIDGKESATKRLLVVR